MSSGYEILFITVPPPRSGNIVEFLAELPGVVEAVAVYTEIDVIALVEQGEQPIEGTVEIIENLGAPIERVERHKIDALIEGPCFNKGRAQRDSSFFAFIRCAINTEAINFEFALHRLSKIDTVRYACPIRHQSEIILQIMAPDKIAFDNAIMSKIQDAGGLVRHTRTYLSINEMHWSDASIPVSRAEYSDKGVVYPLFMSLASDDHDFGISLAEQIYKDTQVKVWHYGRIKPAAESWSKEVDSAIDEASGYLMVVTDNFLCSSECQREFGRIEGIASPEQICCLVLPSADFSELPQRYQLRQCIDGKKFFAYTSLLQWISETV